MESNQSELASQFRRSLSIAKEKRSQLVRFRSFYCILILHLFVSIRYFLTHHYAKSVCIRSFSGLHFPASGLNTERYIVSFRIQSKCGKMRARKIWNIDTFHAVHFLQYYHFLDFQYASGDRVQTLLLILSEFDRIS